MAILRLHDNGQIKESYFKEGLSLLKILHDQNVTISAPCGGNGSCGKCKVKLRNIGLVSSCTYYPNSNIEVVLPNQRESQILTHQYLHSLHLKPEQNLLTKVTDMSIGLGIDIGTTSVVFYWVNLITGELIKSIGVSNPQTKYGADVISRIYYCNNEENISTLQKAILNAINQQIDKFVTQENRSINDIVKVSISANTTMLHLLTGVNPSSIALVPFKAVFTDEKQLTVDELDIKANANAPICLLPSLSAYIGADIIAGLASLNPPEAIKKYLFIDIGTNGEMAIVTNNKIFCCAAAAGPAFEGANIHCGMGAFDGAIAVFNDDGYKTISDDKPIGICGSGLLDAVAYMLKKGIIGADGELNENFMVATKQASGNNEEVVITPQDVREVQLAKSAIFTGIKILMQEAGLDCHDLDAVYLAGGFGNYMNPKSAVTIGLLPEEIENKIITVGNTSGTGAMLHVLSDQFMTHAKTIIHKAELVELANHPEFEMEFAMNTYF
ncbi:ASKHA domain-containing protein [Marinilabilia rubra]|uniref:Ferredoxin n=1 Tax=Marinilabilia rubra TaxID=2162893 RepID=A0A2U2BC01_9BACT|nr:ASKHA domain-containing protein [Marinilabilia rubra]PWE00604.1 ferredoxin [Marinilabilia rubra]